MSAVLAQVARENETSGPIRLRALNDLPASISRLPLAVLLLVVMAAGMVGVLFLSTTIQSLSSQVRILQSEAAMLGYEQDALQVQVNQLRSTTMLAQQASVMGMRPNPYSAIVTLPTGTITGNVRAVGGSELTHQVFTGSDLAPELPTPRVITEPRLPAWDVGKVEKTQS